MSEWGLPVAVLLASLLTYFACLRREAAGLYCKLYGGGDKPAGFWVGRREKSTDIDPKVTPPFLGLLCAIGLVS